MGTPNKPAPPGFRWIFCKAYRNKKTGKLMVAAEYGLECWAFLVRE